MTPRNFAAVEPSADTATPLTTQEVPIATTPSGGEDGVRSTPTTSAKAVADSSSAEAEERADPEDRTSVDAAQVASKVVTTDEIPSNASKEPATPVATTSAEPARKPSTDA